MNYSAFFSSFLSSAFLDFLAFFSFLAGASAAGASSALATVQLVGRRTARARKTTRVSFMRSPWVVLGRESSEWPTRKQMACQVPHRARGRGIWGRFGPARAGALGACGDLVEAQ